LSTAFAQGKSAQQLVNGQASDLAASLHVQCHTHRRAHALNLAKQELHTDTQVFTYSRLVLAQGAEPIRLPLEGDAADRVLSVNQWADYAQLRERLQPGARVLIMGAGLIGCEFANDLAGAGFLVHVVDPATRPLSALLPPAASEPLAQALGALGVVCHWHNHVTQVSQHGTRLQAQLHSGECLHVDLVLSAIGLRPDTAWLAEAGLACERGVRVNHQLQTSDPHVYALGDVAQYASAGDRVLPYVMPIMTAARALGATLAGQPTDVVFPVMPVAVKTPAFALLLALPEPGTAGHWQASEEHVWRFMADDGRCRGFVLGGKQTALRAKAMQWLAA
jgi:rubredoxin-NAD+ reductase